MFMPAPTALMNTLSAGCRLRRLGPTFNTLADVPESRMACFRGCNITVLVYDLKLSRELILIIKFHQG